MEIYTTLKKNTLTLISEIVLQGCDFSDAAYNFAYVSDVQSLIDKSTLHTFFSLEFLLTQYRNAWWDMK